MPVERGSNRIQDPSQKAPSTFQVAYKLEYKTVNQNSKSALKTWEVRECRFEALRKPTSLMLHRFAREVGDILKTDQDPRNLTDETKLAPTMLC